MAATHDEGFFSAHDNLRLFWESDVPDAPKAHVAIIHGYGDHAGRYRRTIDALVNDGYAVHAFDYRGHGQADGRRGHTDKFSDMLSDLELFMNKVAGKLAGKKLFVFAHSHGGLMMMHHLKKHGADGVSGVIVSGPYLKLALVPPAIKVIGAKLIGKVIPWLPTPTGLTSKDLTRDPAIQAEIDKDPLYGRNATPRWFVESNRAQLEALGFGSDIKVPVYMLLGEKDGIASVPANKEFFATLGTADKQLKVYPGMLHEIWNETGREEVWRDISQWISQHL